MMRLSSTLAVLLLFTAGCGSSSSDASSGSATTGATTTTTTGGGSGCPLAVNTKATATVTNGCAVLERDTSACTAARQAQGLSGAWLKFSCRVTLTKTGTAVQAAADSQPDYTSNYFPQANACYAAYTPSQPNPNQISAQSLTINAPLMPNATKTNMGLGVVGMAINGVAIFDNQAAPGDDIFREAGSFDRCGGHPQQTGQYHYHGEPYAISYDDAALIGVLKDGYFVYGRRDADKSLPTLDASGGHTGTTPDSTTPVYHYHLNEQTSTAPTTAGQKQWFLTTGYFHGSPM
jgi:hypothetical protein